MRALLLAVSALVGVCALPSISRAQPGPCPFSASACQVTPTGGTIPRTEAAIAGDLINALACNAKFDNATDDGPAINTCIANKSAAGGGIVLLPAGISLISTSIVPKNNVWLMGMGQRGTFLKCTVNCIVQNSDVQLYSWRMTDLNLGPSGGHAELTVMTYTAMQQSEMARLLIEGFTTGSILDIGGTIPGTITESNLGANVIWNRFHDITVYGCNICVKLHGHYGSTPTASPANSANVPDQVVTLNTFRDIDLFYISGVGYDFIRAADTNLIEGGLCDAVADTGVTCVIHGDDGSYTGNTYVNSNKFLGFVVSARPNVTAMTFFYARNYNFALEAYGLETDINTAAVGMVPLNFGTTAQSYRICGKRLDTNVLVTNLLLGCQEKGIAWRLLRNAGPGEGFVIAIPPGSNSYLITGSGTLTAGQFQMPCGAPDGQVVSLVASGITVTTLTVAGCSGAGSSVSGSNGTISPTAPMQFRYIAASNFWVRN